LRYRDALDAFGRAVPEGAALSEGTAVVVQVKPGAPDAA